MQNHESYENKSYQLIQNQLQFTVVKTLLFHHNVQPLIIHKNEITPNQIHDFNS